MLIVIGLGLASPATLIGSRLIGAAFALSLVRRQPPAKLGFNLALAYLESVVVVIVHRWVLGDESPISPIGWAAAMAAVLVGLLVGWTMVSFVITIHDRERTPGELRRSLGASIVITLAAGLIGIVFLVSLWTSPQSVWLILILTSLVYSFTGAYGSLTKRYSDLQSVFAFSTEVYRPLHRTDVVTTTLEQVRRLMRADYADMMIFEDGTWRRATLGPNDTLMSENVDHADAADLLRLVLASPDRRWFTRTRGQRWIRSFYGDSGFETGIVSTISDPDEVIGLLVAGNRLGPVAAFDDDDKRLLDVLAKQVSDTLARSVLVERLKEEVIERENQAEQLIAAKDDFLASVSHELRTPLTAVLGSAEILQERDRDLDVDDRAELIGYIASEGREISNLVDDLLIATKADLGRLTVQVETIDLRVETLRAVASVQSIANGRAIEAGGLGGSAVADPLRFRQIVRNLLTNRPAIWW